MVKGDNVASKIDISKAFDTLNLGFFYYRWCMILVFTPLLSIESMLSCNPIFFLSRYMVIWLAIFIMGRVSVKGILLSPLLFYLAEEVLVEEFLNFLLLIRLFLWLVLRVSIVLPMFSMLITFLFSVGPLRSL